MTAYFLDSSALVKRYVSEPGDAWVISATDSSTDSILIAEITLAEVAAALAAKQRAQGGISLEQRDRALSRFLEDCNTRFDIVPTARVIIDVAVDPSQRYRLRGYDAVQVGSAVVANERLVTGGVAALTFVASDVDLLAAAVGEGLVTINPALHL